MRTRKNLIKMAKAKYGLETHQVVESLKQEFGEDHKFSADLWIEYFAALEMEHGFDKMRIALKRKAMARVRKDQVTERLSECPICGAPIVERPDRIGFLRAPFGWECTRVVGHFVLYCIRDTMKARGYDYREQSGQTGNKEVEGAESI